MIYRMGKKKRNYSRFYALCKAKGIDLEQYKDDLISQFTRGADNLIERHEGF